MKLPVEFERRAAAAGGSGTVGGTSRGRVAEAGVRRASRPTPRTAGRCIVAVVRGLEEVEETEGNQESSSRQRASWTWVLTSPDWRAHEVL